MKALKLVSSTLLGRTRQAKLCGVGLGAAILVAFCGGPLRAAPGSGNNPGILPPGSTPGDLSYPDWHVACLNWIMSIAATSNPLLNVDDVADLANPAPHPLWVGPFDASVGQSGKVWFLPGGYATVVRDATIPAGKTLVVPLLNHVVWGWPPDPAAEAWMRFYVGLVLHYRRRLGHVQHPGPLDSCSVRSSGYLCDLQQSQLPDPEAVPG